MPRKFTPEQIHEIRHQVWTGEEAQCDLAAKYGVTASTISSIVRMKSYFDPKELWR